MKKVNVALLSGGISSEREISLKGGDEVDKALDRGKYIVERYDPKTDIRRLVEDAPRIDVALIIMHGAFGEDGRIQGMLDLLGIPYQGSGVLGSALAMNKLAAKQLYVKAGLPVPADLSLRSGDTLDPEDCVQRLGLPVVVKPVIGGSSVGVSIVRSADCLQAAVDMAFLQDDEVLIESYIDGLELTGSVIGNTHLQALPIVEIIPDGEHDFFDYKAKYTAGLTQEICPARIGDGLAEKAQTYAQIAHKTLFCEGYSRTDMILKGDDIFVVETNTIPGMTPMSLLPLAAARAGIPFPRLLDKLIELGFERYRSQR